jgi:hypothetical protein
MERDSIKTASRQRQIPLRFNSKKVMNIIKNIVVCGIALMASVLTVNAQEAQDVRTLLTDRSSEEVMEYRKGLNDHDMLHEMEVKGQYKDHISAYDGNVTEPVRLCSKYQASQGFSLGAVARGSYFAGDFLPAIGLEARYGYRWLGVAAAFTIGKGKYDNTADRDGEFLEENFFIEGQAEIFNWSDHHNQIYLVAGASFKLRKDFHDLSFGSDESPISGYVKYNGRTAGGYVGLMYSHSPRFSSWSWYVKATAGIQQNYKGNILGQEETEDYTSYTIGGTKIYPEFGVSVGINLNLFNKKIYNTKAMRSAGYTKAKVKAMR